MQAVVVQFAAGGFQVSPNMKIGKGFLARSH
jgi:hypothetical protein